MKEIKLRVSDEAAKRFSQMSKNEKDVIIKDIDRIISKKRTLREIMDDMSEQAGRNGLTPEKLNEILNED